MVFLLRATLKNSSVKFSFKQTDATTPNIVGISLLVLQVLYSVGSCVQTDAKTPNDVRACSVLWEGHYPEDFANLQNSAAILFSTC